MISTNLCRFFNPMRRSTKFIESLNTEATSFHFRSGYRLRQRVWSLLYAKVPIIRGEVLNGGFNFVQFSFRIPGEMIYFDEHIFVRWLVQPKTRIGDRREISTCLIGGKHQLRLDEKEGVRSRHLCSNGFCSTLYASMPSFLWGYTDILSLHRFNHKELDGW